MSPESIRDQQSLFHVHRTLLRAGLALASTFAWIFVFEFTLELNGAIVPAFIVAVVVYALSQLTLLLGTPLSAAHLRHGIKRALIIGTLCCALAFGVLGATFAGYFSSPIGWGIVLFGILLGAYRALYWIPYRLQRDSFPQEANPFLELLLAFLPAFAGITLVSVYASPLRLLFGASILMLVSTIPIFFLRDHGEPFSWQYYETFKRLFDIRYQSLAMRSALSGIENAALFLIWPIAVFLIVGRSYLVFGFVMTASLLLLFVGRAVYRYFDRRGAIRRSMSIDVAFAVTGWLFRLAAGTPLLIVFADTYSYVSARGGVPEFFSREHASDGGSYVDEYTALHEIGLSFGRLVMCALVVLLLFTTPLPIALAISLLVAAGAAGGAAALSRKLRVEAY